MWPFGKRDILKKRLVGPGFTDWHSHILPGVDDGVQSMDEALEILRLYENAGVREVWLTPHIMEDIPNTTDSLRARFAELQSAYGGALRLHLGSENMLDNLFAGRLACGDLLPVGDNRLLVETSYFNPPMDLFDVLQEIRRKGYVPVLAHPERYLYMSREDYERLHGAGVAFQLNVPSLAGLYGSHARRKAVWLRRMGYYDCEGTDVHDLRMAGKILG